MFSEWIYPKLSVRYSTDRLNVVKKYSDLDFTDSFISLSYRHCQLEGGHDTSEETILLCHEMHWKVYYEIYLQQIFVRVELFNGERYSNGFYQHSIARSHVVKIIPTIGMQSRWNSHLFSNWLFFIQISSKLTGRTIISQ